MKLLEKVFIFLIMALSPMIFSSCSDDDDDKSGKSNIVGTWKYVDDDSSSFVKANYTYNFTSSGRYTWSALSVVMEEGSYIVNDNQVKTIPDNESYAEATLYIKNGKLYDPELDIYYDKQ